MVQDYVAVYSERRDYMYRRLRSLGFEIFGGNGGYMCWVDVTSGSGLSAAEFQLGLLKVAGVQLGGMGWNDRTGREPPPPPARAGCPAPGVAKIAVPSRLHEAQLLAAYGEVGGGV